MADGSSITIKKFIESGADYAEVYYTNDNKLEAGDVVSIDSNILAGVKKAKNNSKIVGVISTNPGKTIGAGKDWVEGRPVPVALKGRVPIKIYGDIKAGDTLSLSSKTGVARKYKEGDDNVIAIALEDYNSENKPEDDYGTVLAFIQIQNYLNANLDNKKEIILEEKVEINLKELEVVKSNIQNKEDE